MAQQGEWSAALAATVGRRVQKFRKLRKISGEAFADQLTKAGVPMTRSVLASLESGRRPTVSLAEWLTMAAILGVPPLTLALPIGENGSVDALPGETWPLDRAAAWMGGWTAGVYRPEGATSDWQETDAKAFWALYRIRKHAEIVEYAEGCVALEQEGRRSSDAISAAGSPEAGRAGEATEMLAARTRKARLALRDHRRTMASQHEALPPLPAALADVDNLPDPSPVDGVEF